MSSENSPGSFPRELIADDPDPWNPGTPEWMKLKDAEYDAFLKARHQLEEVKNQALGVYSQFCHSVDSLGMRWQETLKQLRVYKKRHEDIFDELATIVASPLKAHVLVPPNKYYFLPLLHPYCERRDFENYWKIRITPDLDHPWHEAWMANPDMMLDSAESADSLPPNSVPEPNPYRVPRTRENPWGNPLVQWGKPTAHDMEMMGFAASSTKASGSGSGSGALPPKKDNGKGKAKTTSPGPSSSSSATANRVTKSSSSKPATAAQRATIKRSQVKKGKDTAAQCATIKRSQVEKGKYWVFKADQHLLWAAGLDDCDSDDSDVSEHWKAQRLVNKLSRYGSDYGDDDNYFVLACPAPELHGVCQADAPNFNRHPFKRNRAVEHFRECGVEVEGEEDIFSRFAMQVVQDTARWPVNADWAYKHNYDLIEKRVFDPKDPLKRDIVWEEAMEDLKCEPSKRASKAQLDYIDRWIRY
ncbi:hypothetical protein N0V85_003512 [Neurospora sp. IMI 360204]|nr:hypothetical protein N0V85_003512 [Neurospora sp. IMI 360204]